MKEKFLKYWNDRPHNKNIVISVGVMTWITFWGTIAFVTGSELICTITIAAPIAIFFGGLIIYQLVDCFTE